MDKDVYLKELNKMKELMEQTVNTPITMWAKVVTLVTMNMRYEKIAFNDKNDEHPYNATERVIQDAIIQFKSSKDISFIEVENKVIEEFKGSAKEEKHKELFNEIWDTYNSKQFKEYIERYVLRIKINNLGPLITNKKCLDLGCGNGVFCFALLESGAEYVVGIDYGERSIAYAQEVATQEGENKRTLLKNATVYDTGFDDNYFDFAIQNGVFHHLDNEDKAIREAVRVLKKKGWFWYYAVGEGAISRDLWNASADILRDIPVFFKINVFKSMNIRHNKIIHLSDNLNAAYACTSWDKIIKKLSENGFGNFKRMSGGFNTDFDLERIKRDPYGREKFGEGDLRILCQLQKK